MKNALWLLLVLLTGCGAQLRQPFCETPLLQLPTEFLGDYEVVLPTQSAAWSGNYVLKSARVNLTAQAAMASALLPMAARGTVICQEQEGYYLQQINSNGTYSITKIDKFPQGLIFSMLSIDLDLNRKLNLVQKGFPLHYVPNVKAAMKADSGPDFSSIGGSGAFILDNTNRSAKDVLSVMKPISVQMVLTNYQGRAGKFTPMTWVDLTPKGLRLR